MEQGPTEQSIIEQSIRNRMPLPKAILDAPSLLPGLDFYYVAFLDLTTCRAIGMAEGPIPWIATKDWADEHEVRGDQREDLFFHIGKMDTEYLKYRTKQNKPKEQPKSKARKR